MIPEACNRIRRRPDGPTKTASTPPSIAPAGLAADSASFGCRLRASNLSPRTIQSYLEAVDLFNRYVATQGMPGTLTGIRREHVESFIEHLLATYKPATAADRYAGLRSFVRVAVDEGEIRVSPMAQMRKPRQPEHLPPVLTRPQLEAILGTRRGDSFRDRGDTAILRLLIGTGARLSEVAGLTVEDVNLDEGTITAWARVDVSGAPTSAPRPSRPWTATCADAAGRDPRQALRRGGSAPTAP